MSNPKIDIIVTRHPHLVTVLIERGIATPETPVLAHVDSPSQIEGLHVVGVLPHHLSARAASVTEIPMRWTVDDRAAMQRGDVDLDGTRRAAGEPITYYVAPIGGGGIDRTRPRWLAVARAYEHVERYGYHYGAGPGRLLYTRREWRGLDVAVVGEAGEQHSAEVIESRGVWRHSGRGPWLDGYGREVADDDIEPASGWGYRFEARDGVTLTVEVARMVFESEAQAWAAAEALFLPCEGADGPQGPSAWVSVVPRGRIVDAQRSPSQDDPSAWTDVSSIPIDSLVEVRTRIGFVYWGRVLDVRALEGATAVEMEDRGRRYLVRRVVSWRRNSQARSRAKEVRDRMNAHLADE